MAKPRIFISSTYYDLKHIRNNLETFVENMGYEPILFESGDIPFHHDLALDKSCYKAIEEAHMQILIVGGRYGSPDSEEPQNKGRKTSINKMYEFYNSITKEEYSTALKRGIPIYFFVESNVLSEYDTYKQNRNNDSINYAHVDSVNIFKLIDEILGLKTGNYIKSFEKFEDISEWLKEQWAGLFATYLENEKSKIEIRNLSSKINELGSISTTLKEYSEAIMRKIQPDDYQRLIETQESKMVEEMAYNFIKEGMIDYLINNEKYRLKGTPISIFENFRKSNGLEDFLKKCKLPKEDIQDFIDVNSPRAQDDYEKYYERYLRHRN